MPTARAFWPGLIALALLSAVSAHAQTVNLKLIPSGATPMLAWPVEYSQHLLLDLNPPSILKKAPPNLVAPRYGVVVLGTKEHPTLATFILDEPEGQPSHLYVDSNGNGDLTDDPAPEWKSQTYKGKDGQTYTRWDGYTTIEVHYGDQTQSLRLALQRFDKRDPDQAALQYTLLYHADYARAGEVILGDKTYKVVLADLFTNADFRGLGNPKNTGILLQIDVNGNGFFERRGEAFDTGHPFNIRGTTYEISGMSASGDTFTISKSAQTVTEIPPPPILVPGKPVPTFSAKATDGQVIQFPSAYKGKLVMLFFWASWCGDCRHELPNVIQAYNRFHAQGLEMLGISLDHAHDESKLAAFTQANKMLWPEVYDGKTWQAEVAQLYFVQNIPSIFLVDGNTGQLIAGGVNMVGKALAPTLAKALQAKKRAQHSQVAGH
jgi:thiol-disulfide isomerase/thioredoxin